MHVEPGKGVDEAWKDYVLTRDAENALLDRFRMRGVLLRDVDIDGELERFVVNGVDVVPLVEELLTSPE